MLRHGCWLDDGMCDQVDQARLDQTHDVIGITNFPPTAIIMSESNLEKVSSAKAYGGDLIKYKFKVRSVARSFCQVWRLLTGIGLLVLQSATLGGLDACFNLFLPENAASAKVPVLFYLAGLTCTEDNGCAWSHR